MEIKLFKKERKPLIRISRKANLETWKKILIKISSIIFALILCALISNIIAEGSFFTFLQNVFVNNFASTKRGVTSFSLQNIFLTVILYVLLKRQCITIISEEPDHLFQDLILMNISVEN